MQIFAGAQALTPFRQQKLLALLQQTDPGIQAVEAQYIHFVESTKELTEDDKKQLRELLTYGEDGAKDLSGELFLVVPRIGTISPWSSKATDIIHNSGLAHISRIERGTAYYITTKDTLDRTTIGSMLHDRMTQNVLESLESATTLFSEITAQNLREIDILGEGKAALEAANKTLGSAMAAGEIDYLYNAYKELRRNPTDVEVMMFGVVNSEHCRHKVFNATWTVDGKPAEKSLFKMIKNTYEKHSEDILSAYSDNSAVLKGPQAARFFADPKDQVYRYHEEPVHLVVKVETHNHPTAIAPNPGAATGVGGEIRDEGATGRGAKPKMGLAGYTVSNLNLPEAKQPWEREPRKPGRIMSPLDIMIEAPIGAAAFSNEFGRPNLSGYFRTYEQRSGNDVWGYHKPIMIAGGLGNIRDEHVEKHNLPVGTKIIILGGPAMLIGLGGGAASSMQTGTSHEDLDFASVQRANAEMEHRVQEVIDQCWALGAKNPIISIHDVGAGGLSNALPEIVHDSGLGAHFELRSIPNAEPGLSPMEIWCSEAQERYVLGIATKDLPAFEALCKRERCIYAIVGETTKEERLLLTDSLLGKAPVDLPMSVLFGKPPKMSRTFEHAEATLPAFNTSSIDLGEAVERVLQLPAVASKKFLITIGDRSVGGLVRRDQMVGKWQVPVADVAVTASGFESKCGEAMAMGERTPLALIDAPASARIAIGETITNMAAALIAKLSDIKLSANWMAAVGYGQEDAKLYDTVRAVGEDFCPELGLTIPVGKDSLSMRTVWDDKSVTSPLSLIISGFSPVTDTSKTLKPELQAVPDSHLVLVDLGQGKNRLGGSALAQVYNQLGNETPDITADKLRAFFEAIQELNEAGKLLAYHDRSDGGLFATVAEMMFASRQGANLDLTKLPGDTLAQVFNEELGAVMQVNNEDLEKTVSSLHAALGNCIYDIGTVTLEQTLVISKHGEEVYRKSRGQLERWWARTSFEIQKLRDNPASAQQEYDAISDEDNPGLFLEPTFTLTEKDYKTRPKVAIFREQGVNGQVEMAAAFDKAGFTSIDVHIQDLLDGRVDLRDFQGLVACGGFSYGDVLGAGEGWAKSILFHKQLRVQFKAFFERSDTFTLGVCNGCQMLAALKELIPGTKTWPRFLKNTSEQFEARLVQVELLKSPSIFFTNMEGSYLPIPVAHGEGRVAFADEHIMRQAIDEQLVAMRYVDARKDPTTTYPSNPNGSPLGITSLTTPDGRATIIMPHPERAFLTEQLSWHPSNFDGASPWFKMFQNARDWVEDNS